MGRLFKFVRLPDNAAECVALPALVGGVAAEELIAGKSYDYGPVPQLVGGGRHPSVDPFLARRRQPAWYMPGLYRVRRLMETALRPLRSIGGATRYCQQVEMHDAALCLVATVGWPWGKG